MLLTPANRALLSDPVDSRTAFNWSCSSGVKASGRTAVSSKKQRTGAKEDAAMGWRMGHAKGSGVGGACVSPAGGESKIKKVMAN